MSSVAVAGNSSHYPNNEAADLLALASEGRGDEVVRILESDLELVHVGELNGDTVLHLLASGGYVESLLQVLGFVLGKNPNMLKELARQGNAHGDTPIHLAVKSGHKRIANLLYNVEEGSMYINNDDDKSACELAAEMWGMDYDDDDVALSEEEKEQMQQDKMLLDDIIRKTNNIFFNDNVLYLSPKYEGKDTLVGVYEHFLNALSGSRNFAVPKTCFSDINIETEFTGIVSCAIYEGKILEMLEADPNLIRYKNRRGETILHQLANSRDSDVLTKLVGRLFTTNIRDKDRSQFQIISSLLEGDKYGSTPLHKTIYSGNMKASRYLVEVAPEAAYRVNTDGESPLYEAMKRGYDDLVKYVLEVLPEASMSEATRRSLRKPNKASLPHAAIRLRNFNMLKMILESIPSLIDSLDEKGWKPLSYAAYKGYLDQVHYLLTKFPQSIKKYDSDGSLPIHKAVSGGHVCIIKAFISIRPESLYSVDLKGRNVLHIAVKCRKHDIIRYFRDEVKGVEALYDLRDKDGKTFADYTYA